MQIKKFLSFIFLKLNVRLLSEFLDCKITTSNCSLQENSVAIAILRNNSKFTITYWHIATCNFQRILQRSFATL